MEDSRPAPRTIRCRRLTFEAGKAVTAVAGSVNLNQLAKVNTERNLGIKIMPAVDQAEAFLLLETDRAQAYALDDVQLAVAIARSKEPALFMISEETFAKAEPFGIMLRREVRRSRRWPIARPQSSMRARRSRCSTGSGWNCRRRRTASTTTFRCRRPCATLQEPELERGSGRVSGEVRRGR